MTRAPPIINAPVEMVSSGSGDSIPLRFANNDATLYGADIASGGKLGRPIRIDGVASLVRGQRRDKDDNLFRMAPDNPRITFTW